MDSSILLISNDIKFLESIGACCAKLVATTGLTDNHLDAISTITSERPGLVIIDVESPCEQVERVFAFLADDESTSKTPTLVMTGNRPNVIIQHCLKPPSYYVAKSPNMSQAMRAAIGELIPGLQGADDVRSRNPKANR